MPGTTQHGEIERARIILGLLESVERGGGQTQRHLASELGIALGLVNAYLKRCVKKGLVKVGQAPARRYAYYLTPQGFAEKSRLTVEYLSYSFSLLRRARLDYAATMATARSRSFNRIVLAGLSELADVATICAIENGVTAVAVVDPRAAGSRLAGLPVVASFDDVAEPFDGVVVTDLSAAAETFAKAVARFGPRHVLAPTLLGLGAREPATGASP